MMRARVVTVELDVIVCMMVWRSMCDLQHAVAIHAHRATLAVMPLHFLQRSLQRPRVGIIGTIITACQRACRHHLQMHKPRNQVGQEEDD